MLLEPDYDTAACSSALDDVMVEIHKDEGIVGVREVDTNLRGQPNEINRLASIVQTLNP